MDVLLKNWNDIISNFRAVYEINDTAYKIWIKPLKLYKVENNVVYLIFTSEFKDEAEDRQAIKHITDKFGQKLINVIEAVVDIKYDNLIIISQNEANALDNPKNQPKTNSISSQIISENNTINPKYTFDNFVVGQNNRFAQTAALAVADSPGENYNPLYIYGGPGLGKTHLMYAIGNYIREQNPDKKILYVSSETFLNEVIENIRLSANNSEAMSRFRNKYRNVDVLMVDDIQFIIGKDSTQTEFFYTFNALHNEGKQIIISSDKPPKEMETLDERFKSRFNMGLMADIGYPDYETRMAILRKKSEEKNFTLSDEVMHYIADNIKSNIREIEGALNKLYTYSTFCNTAITLDIAVSQLQEFILPNAVREITPQLIIEVVADHFNITVDQMASKNRSSSVARPRQIAMYLCNNMTDTSLKAIGLLLGGRDHSTIIHGANKISEDIENDEATKLLIDTLKAKIKPQ